MSDRAGAMITALADARTEFGAEPARRKSNLLAALSRIRIESPALLLDYHESLSYIRAFPDDARILRIADRELDAFERRIALCRRAHAGEIPEPLVDSGVVGTPYHYPFGLPMARWLVARYGDSVALDWDAYDDAGTDALAGVAPLFASWAESPALDDETLTMSDWFRRACGERKIGVLRWLVEGFARSGLPEEVQEAVFTGMELPILWRLGRSDASRTNARIGEPRPFFQTVPLRGRCSDLRDEIGRRGPGLRLVSARRGRAWIDLARRALSVRDRELYPLALANEAEVYEAAIGRGVKVVLAGMLPSRRLPIESDYAAFVLRNGMPIGYGVAAFLFERVEIAVNIFPTYRQGESAFVFEQFARLLCRHFGSRELFIERYQLGHENDEGLDAGSFWFYFKEGFRPIDARTRRLAKRESERLRRSNGARSSRATLRRLARSHVVLDLDPGSRRLPRIDLTRIALRVSRLIEERFDGDRGRAETAGAQIVARRLGIERVLGRRGGGWDALRRLSPLLMLLDGLSSWPVSDRRSLVKMLRAKGGEQEVDFVRLSLSHPRFRDALARVGRASRR